MVGWRRNRAALGPSTLLIMRARRVVKDYKEEEGEVDFGGSGFTSRSYYEVSAQHFAPHAAHIWLYAKFLRLARIPPASAVHSSMRFKTFGELDAPEWILAQIVTMAKLSSIRFKMLCTQVIACMIDGSSIDHEKISKMTKDASFDNSDTKAVLAAINHMFRSAARFDCDEEVFSNEIGQLGLPKEHVDAMVRCFKDKKATLRGALREDMISAPLLRSIDWRASVILASSDSAVDKIPDGIAHLHMILNDGGQERIVSFAAGCDKLDALLTELKQAKEVVSRTQAAM